MRRITVADATRYPAAKRSNLLEARYWHLADIAPYPRDVRFWSNSGH